MVGFHVTAHLDLLHKLDLICIFFVKEPKRRQKKVMKTAG